MHRIPRIDLDVILDRTIKAGVFAFLVKIVFRDK